MANKIIVPKRNSLVQWILDAGARNVRAIVDAATAKTIMKAPIAYKPPRGRTYATNGERECTRRRRQIALGALRVSA